MGSITTSSAGHGAVPSPIKSQPLKVDSGYCDQVLPPSPENHKPVMVDWVSKIPASARLPLNPLVMPAKMRGVPGVVVVSIASEVNEPLANNPLGPSAVGLA